MTKREIKRTAQRLAELELIMQNSDDPNARYAAQKETIDICNRYRDLADMEKIDEEVLKILNQS
jgi:hypothetical protein